MKIVVGKGSCGIATGAGEVFEALRHLIETEEHNHTLHATGCIGLCYLEPIVDVIDEHKNKQTYVRVKPDMVQDILRGTVADVHKLSEQDAATLKRQTRIALQHCGIIDPEDINDYKSTAGYQAYEKCQSLPPEAIIEALKTSGLAGRGGAGFPTWFKWQALRDAQGTDKYIICNADEGDPGAFMDRAILEGDPHAVIEGMLIGAYETGAKHGIIYARAEYPLAIHRLTIAIKQARDEGLLGDHFDLHVKAGAGAFVCGEETALIASLEGERGMPRLKPPFPAQKGYKGNPSNINNVETYANVPWIINNGAEAFAGLGAGGSKGTKVFALTGKIKNGGLVEIPMGSSLREVIYEIGGGIRDGRQLKAVQMGGPSGGCIPASLIDTPIDYQALAATGAIMGSGGMVVMDDTTCMVDMARFFLDFICKESCGKCVHCRVGTKRMLEILSRITQGEGEDGDIERLERLAAQIKEGALCGLGNTAPNPVLTTLRYFRHEYEDHIKRRICSAGHCKALVAYRIDTSLCKGCTLCAKNCPVSCIEGSTGKTHVIDPDHCVKCGKCMSVCRFNAVKQGTQDGERTDISPDKSVIG